MSQQRKNIFIDASLTSQRDFDQWPLPYQMGYIHIWIDSDNVGVWKPHFRELNFKLKQEIDPDDFINQVNSDSKRIQVLDNNDWWLINYLPLQVRTLTPNNRPHVSYIEDLRSHGLLTRYAKENPENVKFEVIDTLCNWENIEDFEEKKSAKRAFKYLDSKGLISPLQESYETLARGCQGSKEKEQEQEQENAQVKGEEEAKVQERDHSPNSLVQANDEKKATSIINDERIYGKPSLPNKAPF